MRWRVLATTRTPFWVYMRVTFFVDAQTADDARLLVESKSSDIESVEPYEVVEATPEMEHAHRERVQKQQAWLDRVKAGQNPRGLL
jgi:hypothetical protein